jgi:restriction endonuclease S subunit
MMVPKKKIKDIAELILGHTFRVSPRGVNKSGDLFSLVQVRDISTNGELLLNQLETISHKFSKSIDLLERGDLIFCPREHKLVAALVGDEIHNTVISAPLILIRVHCQQTVKPEYLQLILNSNLIQRKLTQLLVGTSILTLQKSDLEEIELPIPPIDKQDLLARIYNYSKQERKLRDSLYELKNMEREAIVNQSLESLLVA